MADDAKTFMIEDARIIFRNFEGKEGQYNRKGDRNFAVVLDQDTADMLSADGWNVKMLASREEDEPDTPYIQVSVNFQNRPPRVVMVSSAGRTNLGESEVEVLDWCDFKTVDLICRGYEWEVNGKSGVKAYLKTMFATLEEDDLERKYAVNTAKKMEE